MHKISYERLYYILLIVYIFNQVLSESQFVNMDVTSKILSLVRYFIIVALIIFILNKNIKVKKQLIYTFIIMISFIALNFILVNGGISYIPIILFVLASKNFSLEKIFKYTLYTLIISHVTVMLGARIGILHDMIDFRYVGQFSGNVLSGAYYRHNMGFLVHNQIALAYLITYLYIIVIKRNSITNIENIILMILNYVVFKFFGSRIVFILTILVCISFYALKIFKQFQNHKIGHLWFLSYPLFAILSLTTAYLYNEKNNWWKIIDMIFNNRIRMASEAVKYYGVGLIGGGKDAGLYNSSSSINITVDNGYISSLVSEGLIITVVLIGIWMYLTYVADKKNNLYLLFVLILLALENIINTHLGSFKLIPFFCILVNENDVFLNEDYCSLFMKHDMRRRSRLRMKIYR